MKPRLRHVHAHTHAQAFWMHKQAGIYGKYLIPLHLAGTAKHLVIDRNNILKRINPFSFASSA